MKAVMLSIRPEWCEKIAHGQKTIEVRKTKPKLETPFKCYIYCTKDKYGHLYVNNTGNCKEEFPLLYTKHNATSLVPKGYINGMVIGEFVCDYIYEDVHGEYADVFIDHAVLGLESQKEYGGGKTLYGWHISELKIYDRPLELRDFKVQQSNEIWSFTKRLEKAPQSWCYVEKMESGQWLT